MFQTQRGTRTAQDVADDICRETERLYEITHLNYIINKVWRGRIKHIRARYTDPFYRALYPYALDQPHDLVSDMSYQNKCWRMALQKISDVRGEDVQTLLLKRLIEISLGESDQGNIQGLTYLVTNMMRADQDLMGVDDHVAMANDCDSPQAINALAGRIINLVMNSSMSIRVADRILGLLQKKISFIETSEVMADVEELKKIMAQYQTAPVVSATDNKAMVDVTPNKA